MESPAWMLAILNESQIPQDDNVGGVIEVILQKVAEYHCELSKMENKLDEKVKNMESGEVWWQSRSNMKNEICGLKAETQAEW